MLLLSSQRHEQGARNHKMRNRCTLLPASSHSAVSASRDPRDCVPPGSSGRGILQARTLEWVASSFSSCTLGCRLKAVVETEEGRESQGALLGERGLGPHLQLGATWKAATTESGQGHLQGPGDPASQRQDGRQVLPEGWGPLWGWPPAGVFRKGWWEWLMGQAARGTVRDVFTPPRATCFPAEGRPGSGAGLQVSLPSSLGPAVRSW